ncbi:ABC transporter substrate-binding protein, partial [bacterium]|nr:ABC transporter substrate-binding protein [bacterium]
MRPRLLLVLCAVMLAGCPSPQKEGAPAGGTTSGEKKARPSLYRFPLPSDPLSLDPVHITDTVSSAVARQIFNTLVKFDTELNIVNDLAEWHAISDDGLEYKFKLREGVRFHNGDPVTAQDVYYSYKRLVDPANLSERAFWLDYVVGAQEFNRGE